MPSQNEVEILLVEDNPDDADLALRALRKVQVMHRIEHVTDGAQALDFLFCTGEYTARSRDHRPKVILLDLKLPKVDGLEVLQRIKADAATRTIPVVMLTSSREERDLVESYQLGVNSYIVKPVDFEQFMEAVRQLGFYWLTMNQYSGH
ncbi:MAG: response regulator [Candidatus Binatia bacterium]